MFFQHPSLTKASDGFSKEELAAKILVGVPQSASEDPVAPPPMIYMPSWAVKLSNEEIEALVEYIYSLKPQGSGESWD